MIDEVLVAKGVTLMLQGFGVDIRDRNYEGTPARVARMYSELFTPKRNSMAAFPETHDSMIILRGHECVGVCPHHLMPVKLRVYLAYIPSGEVLGLSKLARIIEDRLVGPVLQETFTDSIAHDMEVSVNPKGVAVVVTGEHGCMQLRGVRTHADVVTSCMRGVFRTKPAARNEFLRLIGKIE